MDNEKSIDVLECENRRIKNEVQSLQEDNHQLEWTVQSLMSRIETMEARMALFQEMVGKLSPPKIKVDLMQEEEDGGVGGLNSQGLSFLVGSFLTMILQSAMNSSLLAPESVNPASVDGEASEHPA